MIDWKTAADAEVLWESLTHDVHLPVWVVNCDGRVEYVNRHSADSLTKSPSDLIGRNVTEVMPEQVGRERIEMVKRVAESGRPLILFEMVKGRWTRTILRRLLGPRGETAGVLIIQHPGAAREDDAVACENGRYDVVQAEAHDAGALGVLSRREVEVLALIGEGFSTAEIAEKLCRTVKTVEWHRASLGRKLGVTNRVELAQIAIAAGLSSKQMTWQSRTARGRRRRTATERSAHKP